MSHLVFPDLVTIQVKVWDGSRYVPYSGGEIAFRIRTFARAKNDYSLGAFFCDRSGLLSITKRQLELAASTVLSTGMMDYNAIETAYSLVDAVHLSAADISREIQARKTTWTSELDGEKELYGSLAQLLERLRLAANSDLHPPSSTYGHLRDEWDGSVKTPEYQYGITYVR